MVGRAQARFAAVVALSVTFLPGQALASWESRTLAAKAAYDIYNLDREEGLAEYREAVAADPEDAAAVRGLASALWLSITFTRGNMTVDDYLGNVGHSDLKLPPPSPELAQAFRDAVDRAMALARKRVDAHPKDAQAHYELGSAIGLRASYVITVEGSVFGAVKTARGAYDEQEKVLELDPKRADAGLIVGTYRYVVASLSMPMRMMAYMAGFGGNKEKGLRLIADAAAYPGENQTDARLAMLLLDNREGRYDAALEQLRILREQYPRNRIFWLETGATYLRAGRAAEAETVLNEGLARFANDARPKMFGEPSLWYYKRGMARAALGRAADAEADFGKALSSEGRQWVYGRAHFELGKLSIKAGNRSAANNELRQAVTLCTADRDVATADEAQRLIK